VLQTSLSLIGLAAAAIGVYALLHINPDAHWHQHRNPWDD